MFVKTPKQEEAMKILGGEFTRAGLAGGSRSGKTAIITYTIIYRGLKVPSRHLFLRRVARTCKVSILRDTFPKIMALAFPGQEYTAHNHEGFVTFPNGSEFWFSGVSEQDQMDKILGTEYSTIFANECSEINYESLQVVLSRLAENVGLIPKLFLDFNPPTTSHWLYKLIVKREDPKTGQPLNYPFPYMCMNPEDNRENLPAGYIEDTLANLPERQRMRFLHGEFQSDDPRALWRREWITDNRVTEAPEMYKIYVAIDPAISNNAMSDETGIVVAGIARDGHMYVLEDVSIQGTPMEWAMAAIKAYHRWKADGIVAEKNQGGELVRFTLQTVDKDRQIPIRLVWAARGKEVRAEPISSLYERGEVHHTQEFPLLEDQLTSWIPGETKAFSPDRLDALVYVITELMNTRKRKVKVLSG